MFTCVDLITVFGCLLVNCIRAALKKNTPFSVTRHISSLEEQAVGKSFKKKTGGSAADNTNLRRSVVVSGDTNAALPRVEEDAGDGGAWSLWGKKMVSQLSTAVTPTALPANTSSAKGDTDAADEQKQLYDSVCLHTEAAEVNYL